VIRESGAHYKVVSKGMDERAVSSAALSVASAVVASALIAQARRAEPLFTIAGVHQATKQAVEVVAEAGAVRARREGWHAAAAAARLGLVRPTDGSKSENAFRHDRLARSEAVRFTTTPPVIVRGLGAITITMVALPDAARRVVVAARGRIGIAVAPMH